MLSEDKDLEIKTKIKEIYDKNKGRYGYRRITLVLRSQNILINHKKVKRIMKMMGLYGITPRAKYKSYKGDMNGTVKNLLLDKEIDEVNHKTTYKRNFQQHLSIKNGQQMYQNFILQQGNCIYHQY